MGYFSSAMIYLLNVTIDLVHFFVVKMAPNNQLDIGQELSGLIVMTILIKQSFIQKTDTFDKTTDLFTQTKSHSANFQP